MSWSSQFRGHLAIPALDPFFLIEALQTPISSGGQLYGSMHGLGVPCTISWLPRISSNRVQAVSWRCSYGSWSVQVAGSAAEAISLAPRGTPLRLLAGFPGMTPAEMEPIALGVLRSVTHRPGLAIIEAWDLLSALTTRWSAGSATLRPFYNVQQSTTTTSFTIGVPTLVVADASVLQRESGGTGVVKVMGATPFYLTYTGVAGNTLTGVSLTGQFNTAALPISSPTTVKNVGYLAGHPMDIARKFLVSGSGSGVWDLLPDSWGLVIPDDLVDHDDIDDAKRLVQVSTGTYSWGVLIEEPIQDAGEWLHSLLAVAGIWLVSRQGRISMRAITSPGSNRQRKLTITTSDLVEGPAAWSSVWPDPELAREYRTVRVLADTDEYSAMSAYIETMPAAEEALYDLTPVVHDNRLAIVTEVGMRISSPVVRLRELLTLRTRGWRMAELVAGDLVQVRLPTVQGRLQAFGQDYSDVDAVVLSAAPDLAGHSTSVELWPDREVA